MDYVGGKWEEIRKNRNENAKADVCHQIARQTNADLQNRFGIKCIGNVVSSRLH